MSIFHQNKILTCCVLATLCSLPALAVADEVRLGAVGESAGRMWVERAALWHQGKAPMERVAWAGLGAAGVLVAGVALGRSWRLRRGRVIPRRFVKKCLERLCAGDLGREEAIDYCELNPSPAARVTLGAIRRWGRGAAEVERGAALARQVEVAALRRHVGTLRRVAGIVPLIGLLGTLSAAGRVLAESPGQTSGNLGAALAGTLGPLIAGVSLAILTLVAYDGISGAIESLEGDFERLISRTVDAIAIARDGQASPSPSRSRGDAAGAFPSPHAIPASRSISRLDDEVRPIDRHRGNR